MPVGPVTRMIPFGSANPCRQQYGTAPASVRALPDRSRHCPCRGSAARRARRPGYGSVETRTSSSLPPSVKPIRPSCGTRRSAISSRAITLIAADHDGGDVRRHAQSLAQHTVDPHAHHQPGLVRLDMDIRLTPLRAASAITPLIRRIAGASSAVSSRSSAVGMASARQVELVAHPDRRQPRSPARPSRNCRSATGRTRLGSTVADIERARPGYRRSSISTRGSAPWRSAIVRCPSASPCCTYDPKAPREAIGDRRHRHRRHLVRRRLVSIGHSLQPFRQDRLARPHDHRCTGLIVVVECDWIGTAMLGSSIFPGHRRVRGSAAPRPYSRARGSSIDGSTSRLRIAPAGRAQIAVFALLGHRPRLSSAVRRIVGRMNTIRLVLVR